MSVEVGNAPESETSVELLEREIESLQSQVRALKRKRAVHTSSILSSRSSHTILSRLRASVPSHSHRTLSDVPDDANPLHQELISQSKKQVAHNQECLYRTCAGITTFKVQDPDPFAVDKGAVLGIRVEAFAGAKFIRPYYIFLNKPYPESQLYRVHRHTVPPAIPLAALAAKYLPTPRPGSNDFLKVGKQSLPKFVRTLRKEIASYHNRIGAIAGMRKAFGLDVDLERNNGKQKLVDVQDISVADAEARQIRLEWVDGKIGRILLDSDGKLLKCVIIGEEGRDRRLERRILSGDGRIDGVARRLGGQV